MGAEGLDALFYPRSIALVGIPRGLKAGKVFLLGLLDQGFKGHIYLVHPSASEIDGFKTYPRLMDIPGSVDMVIVMSPKGTVIDVLEECAVKKVKAVILYTSGFSELGDEKGREEEEHMREIARRGGFRIIGPNCMGIYSPASQLAPFPEMPRVPGSVGFLSQSGSLVHLFTNMCSSKRLYFRHIVSYGNSCDVDFPELLEWMKDDDNVRIICAYLEGVKDGKGLVKALKADAGGKPLIMWKVGETDAGSRAAASHTGSLAGKPHLWKMLFKQYGIIEVSDIEELLDTVMIFCHLPLKGQGRVVVVSGPGGPAVSAADAAEIYGLHMASLEEQTIKRLGAILPGTGTSLKNPIDVGMAASFDLSHYLDTLEALVQDGGVDAIAVLGGGATSELTEQYVEGLVRIKKASNKAIIAVAYPGFITQEELLTPLYESGIPVYPTPKRAFRAYAKMMGFYRFQKARGIVT